MQANRELYEQALGDFLRHRGDPLSLARRAEGLRARLLEASLLLCSRDVCDFRAAWPIYEEIRWMAMPIGESAHVAALGAALGGDYARACRIYDAIVAQNPRDLLALAVAQAYDLFLGNAQALGSRTARAYEAWPEHHAVLAMRAFALEECGHYDEAEALARRALELEPRDLRAHHAVAHVMEMQGRFRDGVRWMGERSRWWTGEGGGSTHQWWHLALYHVELGQADQALAIYERRIQGHGVSELIDASALLWRLHLMDVPVEDRFAALATRWERHAEDAHCAFNDMHAMMAFAGAGRWDWAARLIGAQERHLAGKWNTNHDMTRLVGLPACRAIAAYARGEFAAAEALLRALPPVAQRIGGSHAQRDVLQLTRYAAKARIPRGSDRGRTPVWLGLAHAA